MAYNNLNTIISRRTFMKGLIKKNSLNDDDKKQVIEFYNQHYTPLNGDEKKKAIDVRVQNSGQYGSCCFGFKFEGNDEYNQISYKYLTGESVSKNTEFSITCRKEIQYQIDEWKAQNQNTKPKDGRSYDADHMDPEFHELVKSFCAQYKCNEKRTNEEIKHSKLSSEMSNAWKEYHSKNAKLKWTEENENRNKWWKRK